MWGVFVFSVGDDTLVTIISPLLPQVLNITLAKSSAFPDSVNIQLKPGSGANIFTDIVYSELSSNSFEFKINPTHPPPWD